MRGLLGFLGALSSDGTGDENRPSASVGAAFVVAAVVIAVVLLKWMGSDGADDDTIADGWALGTETASGAPTTIPSTPAAVAVRLGTETSSASEAGDATSTRPGGTTATTRPGSSGTGSAGSSPGTSGGTSPTTRPDNTTVSQPPDPTPTDPPPTDPPPTDPPPTDPPPTDPPTTTTTEVEPFE